MALSHLLPCPDSALFAHSYIMLITHVLCAYLLHVLCVYFECLMCLLMCHVSYEVLSLCYVWSLDASDPRSVHVARFAR